MNSPLSPSQVIGIQGVERWQVYHRLQELEIKCECRPHKPLEIECNSPQDAIQVWSVLKNLTESRQELLLWLDRCWQLN